jgi:hypothetical protein
MRKRKPTPYKERHKFNRSQFVELTNNYLAKRAARSIVARLNKYRNTAAISGQSLEEAELQALHEYFLENEEQLQPCQRKTRNLLTRLLQLIKPKR